MKKRAGVVKDQTGAQQLQLRQHGVYDGNSNFCGYHHQTSGTRTYL